MDNNNLQEETVVDDSRRLLNVLTFQDFVLEEDKKDTKKSKKTKPIKKRQEFIDDGMREERFDPNNAPERYVKLREQFIKDELQ